MRLHIITAGPQHATEIGRIQALGWQHAYKGILPEGFLADFTPEKRKKRYIEMRRSGEIDDLKDYLAYLGDEAIGWIVTTKDRVDDAPDGYGEIRAFYLLPGYIGKGYGREMMDYALSRMRAAGKTGASLWVLEENTPARHFYERYGFVQQAGRKTVDLPTPMVQVHYTISFEGR